ncbi:MAG TPA: LysR family transcriptional regulator, partial [Candidatus Limnocylindria bacterium]
MAELRHYRYFVEIAKRGSFTAAAEGLNITQSTLSEQILQLERECGSTLFNRAHSGITLTTAGDYLLPRAQKLLADAAETREGLAGFRTGYHDRLRMASVLGPLQSWLPDALAEFAQLHPHVQLQVRFADAVNEILTQVAAGERDLGVVSLRPSAPARSRHDALEQTVILDEDLVVLAPAGHSLGQLTHVSQADLRETPLILFPPDYYIRQITEDWTRRGGYAPIVAAELG